MELLERCPAGNPYGRGTARLAHCGGRCGLRILPSEPCQRVSSPEDRFQAERKLDNWLFKPTDGVFAILAAVGFCANVFLVTDRHSHSVSDTLYGVFPFFMCAFLLVDWIGRSSSRP